MSHNCERKTPSWNGFQSQPGWGHESTSKHSMQACKRAAQRALSCHAMRFHRPAKRARPRNDARGSILSEPMQAFLGMESCPRSQVVKAIWAYIKENNLQNPKNKQKIILDEKLATIFKPPLDMFKVSTAFKRLVGCAVWINRGKEGAGPREFG